MRKGNCENRMLKRNKTGHCKEEKTPNATSFVMVSTSLVTVVTFFVMVVISLAMVVTSLVMVTTSLSMVSTSLVMVSTSLVTVVTSLALLEGYQRRLLHRNVQGQWKFKSVTYGPTYGRTDMCRC